MRLLIVDPCDAVRKRLSELVETCGSLEALRSMDSQQGLECVVKAFRPDVILLTINTRDARAPERIARLKRVSTGARVIVLADDPNCLLYLQCCSTGADAYLDRTMEFERIVEILFPENIPGGCPQAPQEPPLPLEEQAGL